MQYISQPPILQDIFKKHIQGWTTFELNYVFFELKTGETPDYQSINRQALRNIEPHGVTCDTEKMTSQKITLKQFFGPAYVVDDRRLIVRGETIRNKFFYADEANETPEKAVRFPLSAKAIQGDKDLYDGYIVNGYAQAFTNPVHPYKGKKVDMLRFFDEVNEVLFDDFSDDVTILQWSTDWSSFFEPGKEWWGAYWWTLYNKSKNQVIVIAASATD
jgi:hypothetical protein